MHSNFLMLAVALAAAPIIPAAAAPGQLPPDRETALTSRLAAEKPTLFLFFRPDSAMERRLADDLQRELGDLVCLQWVQLKSGSEKLAQQHAVVETPTAFIYDRRARLVSRTSDPASMRAALKQALGVMRIDWAADDDPRMAEVEKLLGRRPTGGILRTMSLQPRYLAYISELSGLAHFADGFLDRRTKEMIATYVSALNKCKY